MPSRAGDTHGEEAGGWRQGGRQGGSEDETQGDVWARVVNE